jgi:hypothetical protein
MIGKDGITDKEREVLRGLVLYTCEECKRKEEVVGTLEAHRMQRGNAGGKYCPRNIKMICNNCHKLYHGGEFN